MKHAIPMMMLSLTMGAAVAQTLTAAPERMSDRAIAADQATYVGLQERLKNLNAKGVPLRSYSLSKAQCWLDVSLHEYTRNDRSAFPQEALAESAAIIGALEADPASAGSETRLVNGAAKLRPDLWARFDEIKRGAGAMCAAQRVACGEVELVHAGNEFNQQGWRHANPYVQIAEDHAQGAQEAAAACVAPPAPAVVAAPVAPVAQIERISLSADALFRFDKSALADLLPEGRARIDSMMSKLDAAYASIERITLTGHTDRLGTDAYNQALSERRAATIRQYLVSKGFTGIIASAGKGETEQIEACTAVAPRQKLIACLQPNRRVEVEISGVKR